MTSIIKYTLKELEELIKDDKTCVSKKTISQNIAFQPWCLANLKDSLEKIMNNKIGKYDKQLNGIILSYKNVKILDDVYAIHKDNSELFSDVEADFYVFQPHVGASLRGVVSKKSLTHLGVLVHKVFNVVIPTPPNQTSSTWIGSKLHVGQQVEFKIVVLDLFGALPYIRGALDDSFLPPIIDELDSALEFEGESLSSTHVNFEGIKPKFIKNINNVDSSDEIEEKHERKKNKKKKSKDYIPSDSDFVSDVDDTLLRDQDILMKKAMLADKKKNKLNQTATLTPSTPGLKKLYDKKKRGIKDIYYTPTNNNEVKDSIVIRNKKISLSKVDDNKSQSSLDTMISPLNFPSSSNSSVKSLKQNKVDNIITLSPKTIKKKSPKKDKSRHSFDLDTLSHTNGNVVKNKKKRNTVIPLEYSKDNGSQSTDSSEMFSRTYEGKNESKLDGSGRKRLKLENSIVDCSLNIDSNETFNESCDGMKEAKLDKLKRRKLKQERNKNSPRMDANEMLNKSCDGLTESKLDKSERKRLKQEKRNSVPDKINSTPDKINSTPDIIISIPDKINSTPDKINSTPDIIISIPDKIISTTDKINFMPDKNNSMTSETSIGLSSKKASKLNNSSNHKDGVLKTSPSSMIIILSPKPKRKRKYSESFQEKVDVTERCSSSTSPSRKKRKKEKIGEDNNQITNITEDNTSLSESHSSESTKMKRKKKKRDKEERDNAEEKTTDAEEKKSTDNSDMNDRLLKVQELFLQIASDPTLLSDIQTLIKSRRST